MTAPPSREPFRVLSLFSGIGGLDLGLERAGMTIAGQVEIDPWCRKVLAEHWPEVPRHDDVRTCPGWWGDRPAPDLVCGGFPCQPVSTAGQGLAQADSRWLWPAFAGTVRHLRPQYVLVENVPGLLGRGMGDVLADLACLGYDAEWDCIPALFVGAPHIRNRVFVVAYPGGERCNGWPGSTAGRRHAALGEQTGNHAGNGSNALADAESHGLEGPEHPLARQGAASRGRQSADQGGPRMADASRIGRREGSRVFRRVGPAECGWWITEPGVGRVAYGIPHRVDRLRGLGNAVVPQVAEHVGHLILEHAA